MEEPKRKEPMSEEERAELARKLDEDLDRFMETMAAQSVIALSDKRSITFVSEGKRREEAVRFRRVVQGAGQEPALHEGPQAGRERRASREHSSVAGTKRANF